MIFTIDFRIVNQISTRVHKTLRECFEHQN